MCPFASGAGSRPSRTLSMEPASATALLAVNASTVAIRDRYFRQYINHFPNMSLCAGDANAIYWRPAPKCTGVWARWAKVACVAIPLLLGHANYPTPLCSIEPIICPAKIEVQLDSASVAMHLSRARLRTSTTSQIECTPNVGWGHWQ